MNLRAVVMALVVAVVSIATMYGLRATLGVPDDANKTVEVATTIMSSDVKMATASPASVGSSVSSSSGPSKQQLEDAAAEAAETAARSAARSAAEEAARAVVEEALANR